MRYYQQFDIVKIKLFEEDCIEAEKYWVKVKVEHNKQICKNLHIKVRDLSCNTIKEELDLKQSYMIFGKFNSARLEGHFIDSTFTIETFIIARVNIANSKHWQTGIYKDLSLAIKVTNFVHSFTKKAYIELDCMLYYLINQIGLKIGQQMIIFY